MVRRWISVAACLVALVIAGCGRTAPTVATPRKTIEVKTAEEFVNAIGSDRVIRMAPGEYVLSDLKHREMTHVFWEGEHDGNTLAINGVKGLTIEGAGPQRVRLIVRPKYVFVLKLANCESVELRNLTLGHAPDKGHCQCGVLGAANCRDLKIVNCDLFGCGTEGLTLRNVHGLRMEDSIVRDCAYGIMTVKGSSLLTFVRSRFTGNEQYHGFVIEDSKALLFESCVVEKNKAEEPLFQVKSSSNIRFVDGAIRGNVATAMMDPADAVTIEGAVTQDNKFSGE